MFCLQNKALGLSELAGNQSGNGNYIKIAAAGLGLKRALITNVKRVKSTLGSCGKIWKRGSMSRPLKIQYPRVWDHGMNRARRGQRFI